MRPFLARMLSMPTTRADDIDGTHDADDADGTGRVAVEAAGVRSYTMTSGRSQGSVALEIESMLQLTADGALLLDRLQFEKARVAALCQVEILSVAELSARLHLPIGVIRVVASDLIVDGLLQAHAPSFGVADDVDLISRLIEGVRAL